MTPPYARPNRFLDSLQERSATSLWGLWCSIPSPFTAELCAGGGFDWLLFDMEHAPADIKDIYGALQAVSASPLSPMVRPPSNHPVAIKRLLAICVQNLLIPLVQKASEQRGALAAGCKPP